jgi:DNA topoisomerase-2
MAKKQTIEERYLKLSEIDHVLKRPARYIGSISPHTDDSWIVRDQKIISQKVTWNPGFIKIFDEIISNSVDEHKRNPKLNTIKVIIDNKLNRISVWDNGGIPVQMHKEHNLYVPELIFGELRAGSNFDDSIDSTGTGQNGEGSSLTNIFSKRFKVETCDGKKKYTQVWTKNMQEKEDPEIIRYNKNYTKVTYTPDYKLLNTEMTEGNYDKLVKRVYDVAGCNPHLKIYLNGKQIRIKSFKDYINLYTEDFIFDSNDQWKVGIAQTEKGFQQVSFVNGTAAPSNSGTHISYITDQITGKLREYFKKKHKVDVKPNEIKNHLFLFIDATSINPRYASQTKEELSTEHKDYKTSFEITDRFINKLIKSVVIQNILEWIEARKLAREKAQLRRLGKKKRITRIDKYLPATTQNKYLVLCEGDSAMGSMTKILSRKDFGFFALRGKPLNTLEVPIAKITSNKEINNIIQILNLDLSKTEQTDLEYENILIATDMDLDGIAIVGLLMSFFHRFTPDLIKNNKIKLLRTPLLAFIKKKKMVEHFFTMDEYNERMKELNGKIPTGCTVQYYKGLGTLRADIVKELFNKNGVESFITSLNWDPNASETFFNWLGKKNADFRKKALRDMKINTELL